MKRYRCCPALGLAAFAVTAALLGLACVGEGEIAQAPAAEVEEEQAERSCEEMLGTAFRDLQERERFEAECSRWPAEGAPEQVSLPPPPPEPNNDCRALRGRPYESQEQREWFLNNCVGSAGIQIGGRTQAPAPNTTQIRTDCNEIVRTGGRSVAELEWFIANCVREQNERGGGDDDDRDVDRGPRGRGSERGNGRD